MSNNMGKYIFDVRVIAMLAIEIIMFPLHNSLRAMAINDFGMLMKYAFWLSNL